MKATRMRGRTRSVWLRLAVVALLAGCDRFGQARGVDLERMIEQPRYDPYEAGPRFPDDRVLQHPPEGTVPRDRIVGQPLLTRGTDGGGQPAAEIPLPVDARMIAVGRERFGIYCAVCHGVGGYGGSIVATNMQPPLPPALVTGHGADHAPGYYFDVITRGQGRMPSYAAELSAEERWAVVAYLTRVLQQPHPLSPEELLDSTRAQAIQRRYPEEAKREHGNGHTAEQGHEH